jgi:hypothetical protein
VWRLKAIRAPPKQRVREPVFAWPNRLPACIVDFIGRD